MVGPCSPFHLSGFPVRRFYRAAMFDTTNRHFSNQIVQNFQPRWGDVETGHLPRLQRWFLTRNCSHVATCLHLKLPSLKRISSCLDITCYRLIALKSLTCPTLFLRDSHSTRLPISGTISRTRHGWPQLAAGVQVRLCHRSLFRAVRLGRAG